MAELTLIGGPTAILAILEYAGLRWLTDPALSPPGEYAASDHAADAAEILGARVVAPLHFEGWTHFTQGSDTLRAAFAGNRISDRLRLPERGRTLSLA